MSNTVDTDLTFPKILAESWAIDQDALFLANKVSDKVQDSSYSVDDIVDILEKGLRYLSGKYTFPELEAHVNLETDTDANNIELPADFQKNLHYCRSITNNRNIEIYKSVRLLFRDFRIQDQNGRVIGVAVRGRRLYHQRIPSTPETLQVHYYRYPDPFVAYGGKPDWLPGHLVEPLLVAYACRDIFDEIEDGIEGNPVNTMKWERRLAKAESELADFLGPEDRIPEEIPTEIDWEAYL
jgi:hypothetical protein